MNELKKVEFYYYIFCLFHLGSIVTGMTVTSRMILLDIPILDHQFYITGGVFFIPVVFFIQDIVTEIYGSDNAKRMLNINIIIFILYSLLFWILAAIPYEQQNAFRNFHNVANTLPRHTLSFVLSLAIGGKINNYILSEMKLVFNEKFLAFRFISSTAIGEGFFQIVAVLIAWYGTYPTREIWVLALTSYSYKIIFEVLVTPLNISICNYLKSLKLKEVENVF